YYTGIIFRGYADLAADNFLSGGRYDHLLEQFTSASSPAVGLALNLDSLTTLQNRAGVIKKQVSTSLLIHYDLDAIQQAEKLMQETPNSELSFFETPTNAISFAKKWHIPAVIHVSRQGIQTIFQREADL
ncbi:ATP phosphoribosyltransferase regulatory subunit, partial [Listeria monocytogenes]|nr:ATP phosphoribosyltransferase regulatory subunit [Listeria monocytogenes]